jgi:hypothetical protein
MKSGRQSHCRTCARQWHHERPEYVQRKNAEWKASNPTYARDWQRKKKYGLTSDEIEQLRVAQKHCCAGCDAPLASKVECIDHCHSTGKVRGILCRECNIILGMASDNAPTLQRLARYLSREEAEAY